MLQVPELCRAIIDTPQFNRLRCLNQLGTVIFRYHFIFIQWLQGKIYHHNVVLIEEIGRAIMSYVTTDTEVEVINVKNNSESGS